MDHQQQQQYYVRILEQPAPKALRFRYECEGRSAGSLPGANSSSDKKTFPKIQIVGYSGRAVVVVSCVTNEAPYRPHPHNLVGKDGCKKGVCTMEIANEDMTTEFSNLGIQCVKKKDIEDSLKVRSEIRVDPFRTGFGHATQPGSIDLNSVRLCFQVFLEGPERGQFKIPLKSIVSDPIYDKKAINDLTIMKLSDSTSPVSGNKEIILLCDKVSKDDIEIRFYEEGTDGSIVWESYGDFQPSDVHKQYAISFRTPQYRSNDIKTPARVFIQLRCPSKDTTSVPRPFEYIPLQTDMELLKRKRQKLGENNSERLTQYFNEACGLLKRPRISQPQNNTPPPGIQVKTEPINLDFFAYGSSSSNPIGFSGGGLQNNNNLEMGYGQMQGSYYEQQQQQGQGYMGESQNDGGGQQQQGENDLLENISLPNLSDVNLSLLENHLSENFSTNLILIDPDVQALGLAGGNR